MEKELTKVKAKLDKELKAKKAAKSSAEKREDRLRKSVESLLGEFPRLLPRLFFHLLILCKSLTLFCFIPAAADTPVDRADKLRVDSMEDAVSFDVDANEKVQGLLAKTKTALSKLYSLVFPKLSQQKTLEELTGAFFVDGDNPIEVLKRSSRIYGALLAFQLLMGYNVGAEFENLLKSLPKEMDGSIVDLGKYKKSAHICARQLIDMVDAEKAKKQKVEKAAPAASGQSSMP